METSKATDIKVSEFHPPGNARWINAENVARVVQRNTGSEAQIWPCPCGASDCMARAVFARGPDRTLYLITTISYVGDPGEWPCYSFEDADIIAMMANIPDTREGPVPAEDLCMLRGYLSNGLKEALLAE